MKQKGDLALGIVMVIIVPIFAVIVVAGLWQLGWFVNEKNVDRQTRIDNRSVAVQSAWHDQAVETIADFYLTPEANTAARGALRAQACGLTSKLVGPYVTPDIYQWNLERCQ